MERERRITQNQNPPNKWRVLIKKRQGKKERIIYSSTSTKEDSEDAWTGVFSKWLESHKELLVCGIGSKGIIAKYPGDPKAFEIFVDYHKIKGRVS